MKLPDGSQHLGHVAGDLHFAPLLDQHAGAVDEEGGALDATHLLAIHVLQSDDVEQRAERLIGVADQREGQLQLLTEVGVAFQAVARDAVSGVLPAGGALSSAAVWVLP